MSKTTYRDFWAEAKVPLPNPLPTVLPHAGPITDSTTSFTTWDGLYIVLVPTDVHSEFAVMHETGHVFDLTMDLTKADRQRIARIIGHPGLRWFWGSWNPLRHIKQPNMENFADWYAQCAMGQSGPQHMKLLKVLEEIAARPR